VPTACRAGMATGDHVPAVAAGVYDTQRRNDATQAPAERVAHVWTPGFEMTNLRRPVQVATSMPHSNGAPSRPAGVISLIR
jgi:hypothetical protein